MSTNIRINLSHAKKLAADKSAKNQVQFEKYRAIAEQEKKKLDAEIQELERKLDLHKKDRSYWGPTRSELQAEWELRTKLDWRRFCSVGFGHSPKDPRADELYEAFKLHIGTEVEVSVDDIRYLTS
jgi:hypothetical protein